MVRAVQGDGRPNGQWVANAGVTLVAAQGSALGTDLGELWVVVDQLLQRRAVLRLELQRRELGLAVAAGVVDD